jgi:hypothetical protein
MQRPLIALATLKDTIIWGALPFFILISGCATKQVAARYVPGPQTTVQNEVIVREPFSKVWDTLVRELAKSFFVINNIEKESRIINVSFFTQTPQDYADCGRTYRQPFQHKP